MNIICKSTACARVDFAIIALVLYAKAIHISWIVKYNVVNIVSDPMVSISEIHPTISWKSNTRVIEITVIPRILTFNSIVHCVKYIKMFVMVILNIKVTIKPGLCKKTIHVDLAYGTQSFVNDSFVSPSSIAENF